ncbi:hypothetical protein GCM10025780_22580 [Frondihabitans cladoniiphilus]|uniref:Uncharacterized protein n=1 Tax=Frondihabitans cladoniiphilus TaxID=715785 RepID=A0ABP8W1U1_9MICO
MPELELELPDDDEQAVIEPTARAPTATAVSHFVVVRMGFLQGISSLSGG